MKKTVITLLAAAFLSTGMALQAAERTQKFNGNISHLKCTTGVDVVYVPTSTGSTTVKIAGPDEGIKYVKVELNGSKLSVHADRPDKSGMRAPSFSLKGVTVTVTGPMINSFEANSSGDIKCGTKLNCNGTLTLKTTSSGDIKFGGVDCTTLRASTNSSGDIDIKTLKCTDVTLSTSSSGDIDVYTLNTSNVVLQASSSGDIDIKSLSAKTVHANASSSGDIDIDSIKADVLDANSSSSAEIKIKSGTVKTGNLNASSVGDIVVGNVRFGEKNIHKSSGGNVKIGTK